MVKNQRPRSRFVTAISRSRLSIYDLIEVGHPKLWIPSPELEALLEKGLKGLSLAGLPLRTRSKVVKQEVCEILGYPVPTSFKRTKPRFPGQAFDTYIQKSNNVQVWNEDLAPTRRYVLIRVSTDYRIERVRVVTGADLALLDTTGTLTQKYQARIVPGAQSLELISAQDTANLLPVLGPSTNLSALAPTDSPKIGSVLPISLVFSRLGSLVSREFIDSGQDQERNRAAELHRLVCEALGYRDYRDDGRFPDVRHQLLEVKLQTAATIDLGLVRPNSLEPLDLSQVEGRSVRHCDVRYAVFYARTDGSRVTLTHLYVTTGEAFFTRFAQFQGRILNKKLQIRLPRDFFDR